MVWYGYFLESPIQENVAFNILSVTQSIPTRNGLKTKLCTFARKQILRKPIKKLVKK